MPFSTFLIPNCAPHGVTQDLSTRDASHLSFAFLFSNNAFTASNIGHRTTNDVLPASVTLLAYDQYPTARSCDRAIAHTQTWGNTYKRSVSCCTAEQVIASVKIYPRAILSTPGTSGHYISYKRVLAVLKKPLRWGYILTEVMKSSIC